MRLRSTKDRRLGATIADFLIAVAVVGIVVVVLMPRIHTVKRRAFRVGCADNLKQVFTGLRLFANDADGRYPFAYVSSSNTNLVNTVVPDGWRNHPTNLWKLLQLAGPNLSNPRIFICPSDAARTSAEDFLPSSSPAYSQKSFGHPSNRNLALSYFLALDVKETRPTMLLAGDRNLARDSDKTDNEPGRNCLKGEQRLGSTEAEVKHLRWNDDIHERSGNIVFMDGSAQPLASGRLRDALRSSGDKANRVWLPQ